LQRIILVQLGSPKSPSVPDVREFLREFLLDPRISDLPRIFWWIILYFFILPFRSPKSAKLYEKIWSNNCFPLVATSDLFARKLEGIVGVPVDSVYRYGDRSISKLWERWDEECRPDKSESWLVVPMYPQFSECTTASVLDLFYQEGQKRCHLPEMRFINSFYSSEAFLNNFAKGVNQFIQQVDREVDYLVFSFHGLPESKVTKKGDPYLYQCQDTFKLLAKRIDALPLDRSVLTFQSRMGRGKWLSPYTGESVLQMVKSGAKSIAVCCPSFTVDSLETLVEIGIELKGEVANQGATVHLVPALNCQSEWVEDFADFLKEKL
jgi:protoporphyrin/coproporphyrin ferrochelatase